MSIPTDVAFPSVSYLGGYDLTTNLNIALAVDSIRTQMLSVGWTDDPLYAHVTYDIDLPLSLTGLIHIFMEWVTWVQGFAFVAFNSDNGNPDPTGNFLPGVGPGGAAALIVGVEIFNSYSQGDAVNKLITVMNMTLNPTPPFWSVVGQVVNPTYGAFSQLLITSGLPGATWNNQFMNGNANGGGVFDGTTHGGGFVLTSVATPTNGSKMRVITDTQLFIDNLRVTVNFDNFEVPGAFTHSPGAFYCNFKPNMNSVVTPYSWAFFHTDDGMPYTPRNNSETFFGGDCFYMCNPRVDAALLSDPITPIGYCGAYTWGSAQPPAPGAGRDLMRESFKCYTRINNIDTNGPFSAFQVDCGVNWYTLNSMFHAAGELDTTAGKSIQISSLLGLSTAHNGPLKIIGDCWGMYLETRWYPLDTLAKTPDEAHTVWAYRSQQAPCEATLWMAID